MKISWKGMLASVLAICLAIAMASCGSSSSSSGSSDSSSSSSGASVSGTIAVSSADLAQVNRDSSGTTVASARILTQAEIQEAIDSIDTELREGLSLTPLNIPTTRVTLRVMNSDGTCGAVVDTVSVNAQGGYSFSNVDQDKKYCVNVEVDGYDNQGVASNLCMTCPVPIDSDDSAVDADCTEKGNLVYHYQQSEVFRSDGTAMTKEIMDEFASLILDSYTERLADGSVRRVSPVQATSAATTSDTDAQCEEVPEALRLAIGDVAADADLVSYTRTARIDSQLNNENITLDRAMELMRAVFDLTPAGGGDKDSSEGGRGGGGIPEFFLEIFATAYIDGTTVTIAEFAQAFNHSVLDPTKQVGELSTPNVITDMLDAVNTTNSKIRRLYAAYDSDAVTASADIPPAARAVFPKAAAQRWSIPVSQTQTMTVPQAMIVMGLAGLMGDDNEQGGGEGGEGEEGPDMDFDPFVFLEQLQYVDLDDDAVYITEIELFTEPVWKESSVTPNEWNQVDALVSHMALWASTSKIGDVDHVTLIYPTETGTSSKNYTREQRGGGEGGSEGQSGSPHQVQSQSIHAYNQSVQSSSDDVETEQRYALFPWTRQGFDETKLISDFVAGTANVVVFDSNGNALASENVRVYSLSCTDISWEFPTGPDMDKVQGGDYHQFFEPLSIELPSGENAMRPRLKWSEPDCSLPDDHYLAYALNLGQNLQPINHEQQSQQFADSSINWNYTSDNGNYRWRYITSTWDEGRFISVPRHKFNTDLSATTRNGQNNYRTMYEVNVRPLVISETSGQIVWSGNESRTEFSIAEAGSNDWSITLNGTISFPTDVTRNVPRDSSGNIISGSFKIGLFHMGGPNLSTGEWVDAFFSDTSGPRSPVTANGVALVDTLGTLSTVTASSVVNGYHAVTYQLPAFDQDTNPLVLNNDYILIIWYDFDSAEPNLDSTWTTYGSANTNKMDMHGYYLLEFPAEPIKISIVNEFEGVLAHDWNEGETDRLVDDSESQTIDHTIGLFVDHSDDNNDGDTTGSASRMIQSIRNRLIGQ